MPKNELVSLALVFSEPRHAYAINNIVREIDLENWARISQPSLYGALSRLEREGCVAVEREKVGAMPERKVYAITERGKERLAEELTRAVRTVEHPDDPFYLAMMFAFGLDSGELRGLLGERIERLEAVFKHLENEYIHVECHGARNAAIMIGASMKHVRVEIDMTREFVALLDQDPDFYRERFHEMFRGMGSAGGKEEKE